MKLDVDPFPVNTIGFEEKAVLVRTNQAATTKGKNVIVSDELRNRMIKHHSLEVGVWKGNRSRRPTRKERPSSSMLIKKYIRQQQMDRGRWLERKRRRSLLPQFHSERQGCSHSRTPPGKSWTTGNKTWVCANMVRQHSDNVPHEEPDEGTQEVILIGSVPCRISSELHVDGKWVAGSKVAAQTHARRGVQVDGMPKRKRVWLIMLEGHEVIGSGYMGAEAMLVKRK
jgi:hypothetical protein